MGSFVESGLIESLGDESARFHAFQIWPICSLFRLLEFNLDAGISYRGLDPDGLKQVIDLNWSRRAESLIDFPKSEACVKFNRQLLPLLLWIESYFLPSVRNVITSSDLDSNTNAWNSWRQSRDLHSWLDKHSVSIEQLSDWRDRILSVAFHFDPSPDLYLLLRSIPFSKRDRFRNRLRLAYDLYEIAEITRLFLEYVSDRPERKEWDPTGNPVTTWVERLYGTQPRFDDPKFLRPLVRSYRLDPAPRVRWIVEGESEKSFILSYAERLGRNIEDYATVTQLGGDGVLKGKRQMPALIAYLEAAREEQCFSSLTFDNSDPAVERMRKLVDAQLITL